jgi:hypothetical protein
MGLLSFLFGCSSKSPYQQKNGTWYYDDRPMNLLPAEKLIPLNNRFARSDSAAYYRGAIIAGSNGQHFEALGDHYAKDDKQVWYCDTYRKGQEYYSIKHNRMLPITDANPASFTTLAEEYAKDSKAVYFEGIAFPVKDVGSFQVLGYGYGKDNQVAYYQQTVVAGSDGPSFVVLGNHYAKDSKHVYYSTINTNEPNKLQVITTIVKEADLASFVVADLPADTVDARDKNRAYLQGKKLP